MYVICEMSPSKLRCRTFLTLTTPMLLLIDLNLLTFKDRVIYDKRTVPPFQTCLTYFL
jgi:hypothetical protein